MGSSDTSSIARELRLLALRAEQGELVAATVITVDARNRVRTIKFDDGSHYDGARAVRGGLREVGRY